MFRDLREKKRHFIFGQTLFVSGLKVHLDKVGKDKRNRYSKRICATRLKAKRQKTN